MTSRCASLSNRCSRRSSRRVDRSNLSSTTSPSSLYNSLHHPATTILILTKLCIWRLPMGSSSMTTLQRITIRTRVAITILVEGTINTNRCNSKRAILATSLVALKALQIKISTTCKLILIKLIDTITMIRSTLSSTTMGVRIVEVNKSL